jgi:flagellum-specific ATP synthase
MNTSLGNIIRLGSDAVEASSFGVPSGRLTRVTSSVLEVRGLSLPMGGIAYIDNIRSGRWIEAECVGFKDDAIFLMTFDSVDGLAPNMRVYPAGVPLKQVGGTYRSFPGMSVLPISEALFGRVVDGLGRPIDGRGGATVLPTASNRSRLNPLERGLIKDRLDTGIRAIDGFLTIGRGQRIGIFAGSGIGKSTLISLLGKNCIADVVVIGLVGERSREVKEFCEAYLDEESSKRSIIVSAPADASPLARTKGAEYASRIASYFRDSGRHTILILDSLTRYAMAQREIGLSLGESPVSRGFPPSVFEKIPILVEQSGNSAVGHGSLTSFYTVLLESEEFSDPVAEAARGCLDGHISLSGKLSGRGHFPAIDIERSLSRVMPNIVTLEHMQTATRLRALIAKFHETQELRSMGVYSPGVDIEADLSLKIWPRLREFLQQGRSDVCRLEQTLTLMNTILSDLGDA